MTMGELVAIAETTAATLLLAIIGFKLTEIWEKGFRNWDWVHKREMKLAKRKG